MNKILKDGYLIVFFLLLIYLFQLQFAYVTENSTSGILCVPFSGVKQQFTRQSRVHAGPARYSSEMVRRAALFH